MSKVRIRCRAPELAPSSERGAFPCNGVVASWEHVSVVLVADDGTEHPMGDVTAVAFSCREGQEAEATLTFLNPEVELDAEVEP